MNPDVPEQAPRDAPLGRVVTFYSYKGGTGRSMALANTAWILALNGYRVLLIDWDLEAPGLHRYFHPFLADKELQTSVGLLDLVEGLAARAATSSTPLAVDDVDIFEYVTALECPRDSWVRLPFSQLREQRARRTEAVRASQSRQESPYVGIDLMPAGRQGATYAHRLSAFNWIDFYERLGGRRLIGLAKQQMREVYDYVLIDSRTGVSDTSGICTIEMPDTLVVCFTLNDQSILGASGVARSIREQQARLAAPTSRIASTPPAPEFRIFPIPTRVEVTSERDKREAALELAQKTFAPFLSDSSPEFQSRYWGSMQMAYFPYYAFEEIPAIFGDRPDDQQSLVMSFRRLVSVITGDQVADAPTLANDVIEAERVRKEILGWYLRPTVQSDPVQLAQHIYDGFDEQQRDAMRRVLLRLVTIGTADARSASWDEVGGPDEPMTRTLVERRLLSITESHPPTVRFREAVVAEKWEKLKEWIETDREFLTWRAALSGSMESWTLRNRSDSLLLRGPLLDEATSWLPRRDADLSTTERQYVEASFRLDAKMREQHAQSAVEAASAQARTKELERVLQAVEMGAKPEPQSWMYRLGRWLVLVPLFAVVAAQFYCQYRSEQRRGQETATLQKELQSSNATIAELRTVQADAKPLQSGNELPTQPKQAGTAAPEKSPIVSSSGYLGRVIASKLCPKTWWFVNVVADGSIKIGLAGTTVGNNTAELVVRTSRRGSQPTQSRWPVGQGITPIEAGGRVFLVEVSKIQECTVEYRVFEK